MYRGFLPLPDGGPYATVQLTQSTFQYDLSPASQSYSASHTKRRKTFIVTEIETIYGMSCALEPPAVKCGRSVDI